MMRYFNTKFFLMFGLSSICSVNTYAMGAAKPQSVSLEVQHDFEANSYPGSPTKITIPEGQYRADLKRDGKKGGLITLTSGQLKFSFKTLSLDYLIDAMTEPKGTYELDPSELGQPFFIKYTATFDEISRHTDRDLKRCRLGYDDHYNPIYGYKSITEEWSIGTSHGVLQFIANQQILAQSAVINYASKDLVDYDEGPCQAL